PIILYNIPSRVVIDLPNEFLAELAQIDGVSAVKQARGKDIEPIPGLDLLAGNDDDLAEVLDKGGTGGILVSAHFIAREMRRMIVVDTGLALPTPEQLGIDLVLPDFSYLRERADQIEAIVLTHGHEDHVGALPFVAREIGGRDMPPVYGGPLTIEMVRSKLDEHRLVDSVELNAAHPGEPFNVGPFDLEPVKVAHSIPDPLDVAA